MCGFAVVKSNVADAVALSVPASCVTFAQLVGLVGAKLGHAVSAVVYDKRYRDGAELIATVGMRDGDFIFAKCATIPPVEVVTIAAPQRYTSDSDAASPLLLPEGRNESSPEVPAKRPASEELSLSQRPLCKYGRDCYRRNPVHFREFRHPHREGTDDG